MGGVGGFYDSDGVFEAYMDAVQPGPSSPNHVMEEPAVLDALGDVAGLRVLDLGCGDAALGSRLLRGGCRSYLGIDASAKMVDAARATLRGGPGEVGECPPRPERFDGDEAELARRRRIPLFLLLAGHRLD